MNKAMNTLQKTRHLIMVSPGSECCTIQDPIMLMLAFQERVNVFQ